MTSTAALANSPKTFRDLRDEWIVEVLSDLELSPAARVVGAYLGLGVDLDDWPSIPLSGIGGHLRVLPLAIWMVIGIDANDGLASPEKRHAG